MSTHRCRGLVALALGLLLLLLPATAQALRDPLPIGDPIENDNWWLRPVEGSFRLEAARAADPDGGPRWAIGTFRAEIAFFPPGDSEATCVVLGRLQGGQLGMPTEHGEFRPFASGAGAGFCATTPPDERWPMTGVDVATSVLLDEFCLPRRIPEDPSIPECDPALVRTVNYALLGPGDFRAWAPGGDGRYRPVPMESDGSLLVVERGQRERLLPPVVSFRICGANSRPDLVDFATGRGTIRGCLATMTTVPVFWATSLQAGDATPGACGHLLSGSAVAIGRSVDVCTAPQGQ